MKKGPKVWITSGVATIILGIVIAATGFGLIAGIVVAVVGGLMTGVGTAAHVINEQDQDKQDVKPESNNEKQSNIVTTNTSNPSADRYSTEKPACAVISQYPVCVT